MKKQMIIISGPSCSGQDSIIEGLSRRLAIERVITTTTRSPRPTESPGHPYYFISQKEFLQGIKKGNFFEYAQEYNNNYYGVTHQELKRVLESGEIGIWRIEYKGVMYAKEKMPGIIAILINAPLDVLEKRLRRRDKTASDQYIGERMEYTKNWLNYKYIYDYEVVNEEGKLDEAIDRVEEIIRHELGLTESG